MSTLVLIITAYISWNGFEYFGHKSVIDC